MAQPKLIKILEDLSVKVADSVAAAGDAGDTFPLEDFMRAINSGREFVYTRILNSIAGADQDINGIDNFCRLYDEFIGQTEALDDTDGTFPAPADMRCLVSAIIHFDGFDGVATPITISKMGNASANTFSQFKGSPSFPKFKERTEADGARVVEILAGPDYEPQDFTVEMIYLKQPVDVVFDDGEQDPPLADIIEPKLWLQEIVNAAADILLSDLQN